MSVPPGLSGAALAAWLQAQVEGSLPNAGITAQQQSIADALQAEVERRADARSCDTAKKIAAIRSNPPVVPIPTVLPLSGKVHQPEVKSLPIVKIRPSVKMPEAQAVSVPSVMSIQTALPLSSTIYHPEPESPPIVKIRPSVGMPEDEDRQQIQSIIFDSDDTNSWRIGFDIVRVLRKRFRDAGDAIEWLDVNGFEDYADEIESLWDEIRCPEDALVYSFTMSDYSFNHSKLNLLDRPSRLRLLAGMAFHCQRWRPDHRPFFFAQARLSAVLDCHQSSVQRDIRHLVKVGWLEIARRWAENKKTMVMYSCPASFDPDE